MKDLNPIIVKLRENQEATLPILDRVMEKLIPAEMREELHLEPTLDAETLFTHKVLYTLDLFRVLTIVASSDMRGCTVPEAAVLHLRDGVGLDFVLQAMPVILMVLTENNTIEKHPEYYRAFTPIGRRTTAALMFDFSNHMEKIGVDREDFMPFRRLGVELCTKFEVNN